jgi:hypothetical protein
LWSSILGTNKTQVAGAVEALIKVLTDLKENLGECEMAYTFDRAANFASALRKSQ